MLSGSFGAGSLMADSVIADMARVDSVATPPVGGYSITRGTRYRPRETAGALR